MGELIGEASSIEAPAKMKRRQEVSLLEQTESIRFVVNSDSAVEQALQYISMPARTMQCLGDYEDALSCNFMSCINIRLIIVCTKPVTH